MAEQLPTQAAPHAPKLETLRGCPLCDAGGLLLAPLQPPPPFGLNHCASCGGVFLSPRPARTEMSHYYDEFYAGDDSKELNPRQQKRAARHFSRLQRHTTQPGRLLEVGAGDGYFLKTARDAGWQVEGIELSRPRAQRAKLWFQLSLHCCELPQAPLGPNSFDAAVMFQLIEHLHEPRAALQQVYSLLKPGGLLMLSTPNVLAYARKGRGVDSWRIPRHLFFFSPRSLVRTLERCNFEVLNRSLKLFAALEERLGWQPWPSSTLLGSITRDLSTPFGIHLVARKK